MGSNNPQMEISELKCFTPMEMGDANGIFDIFRFTPRTHWQHHEQTKAAGTEPGYYYFGCDGSQHHHAELAFCAEFPQLQKQSGQIRRREAKCWKKVCTKLFQSQC